MEQLELASEAGIVGVVMTANISMDVVVFEARSQGLTPIQKFAGAIAPHRHRVQRQMAQGYAQLGRTGLGARQTLVNPGELGGGNLGGGGIPDEVKISFCWNV